MKREGLALLALWLVTFVSTSQFLVVAPMLGAIGEAHEVGEGAQGLLISAYGVTSSLSALLAGPASDRFGRRPVLLIGSAFMAVALVAHGLAFTYPLLFAARAAAGAAGGMLTGTSMAYIGDVVPYARRGRATGILMSAIAVGQVLSVGIAEGLIYLLGIDAPFVAFGLLMALTVAFVWAFVEEDVIVRAPLDPASVLRTYASLLAPGPTLWACLAFVVNFIGIAMFLTFVRSWLSDTFDAGGLTVAVMFACGGVAAVIANPLAGAISDRIGRRGMILGSCVGFAAVLALTTVAVWRVEVVYPWFFLMMAVASIRVPPLQALMTELVTAERRGTLLALSAACAQVGFALGAALAGGFYGIVGFAVCTWIAAASVLGMAAIVWAGVPEPEPLAPPLPARAAGEDSR